MTLQKGLPIRIMQMRKQTKINKSKVKVKITKFKILDHYSDIDIQKHSCNVNEVQLMG